MLTWAQHSEADVIAVQEHDMHLDKQLNAAAIKLDKAGWLASCTKALPTGKGAGTSGGVANFVDKAP